jgi:hypothetical protein
VEMTTRAEAKASARDFSNRGKTFSFGSLNLGFEFVADLQLVFNEFVQPVKNLFQLLQRELRDHKFDFLNSAHRQASCLGLIEQRASANVASATTPGPTATRTAKPAPILRAKSSVLRKPGWARF